MPDTTPTKKRWIDDFLNPFNAISLLVGVIGLILAYYFYVKSDPRPELSWSVATQKIVDAGKPFAGFSVSDAEGQPIKGNVYAAEVTVWNSGNTFLDADDPGHRIRFPLTLVALHDARLLSTSVSQTTTGMNENELELKSSPQTAVVTWQHLDPNTGFKISALYAGTSDYDVGLKVDIAGMSNPDYVVPNPSIREALEEALKAHAVLTLIAIGVVALAVVAFALFASLRWSSYVEAIAHRWNAGSLLAFFTIYFGVLAIVGSLAAVSLYMIVLKPPAPTGWVDAWRPGGFD